MMSTGKSWSSEERWLVLDWVLVVNENELLFESAKKFKLPLAWHKINSSSYNIITKPFLTEGLFVHV